MRGRVTAIAALAGLAVTLTACGDDDAAAGTSIDSIDEWCSVIDDVDNRFETTDNSSDAFDVKQEQYQEINALLNDLDASVDIVDPDARDAVAETIAWAVTFTDVFVAADSEQTLSEELFGEDGVFAEQEEVDPAGAAWIDEHCGVDVNGEN